MQVQASGSSLGIVTLPQDIRKPRNILAPSKQPAHKKKKEFKPYSPKYAFNKDSQAILKEIKGRISIEKRSP